MYFNSWNEQYKIPFGAVCCTSRVEFNFQASPEITEVFLVISEEDKIYKYPMNSQSNYDKTYSFQWYAPESPALLWYYFEVHKSNTIYYYGNNEEGFGGEGSIYFHDPKPYQLTVYKNHISTPSWLKNGVIYQIFVDRFYNGNEDGSTINTDPSLFFLRKWNEAPQYERDDKGNVIKYDFYGGNLKGVIEKLPYLKSLGISIIYLNPVFQAFSNHKYDTADYKKIDPMYGDEETLKLLCSEAEKIGISIILDGVFNHTGSNSVYFNKNNTFKEIGAFQSKESPYYNWYSFINYPYYYKCWWGIETMPTLNKDNKAYCDFIMKGSNSVIHYWMNLGIKGWRLDVVDELSDEFVQQLKEEVKHHDNESILIGEVWEDASNKISYGKRRKYLLGDELDSVMNYPLRRILLSYINAECTAYECMNKLINIYENYPKEYFYSTMNLIGSHDVPRILTTLEDSIKKLKMITLFQITFPGVPSIYYGDEVGCKGLGDPYNRGTYPWGRENEELLQWHKDLILIRNNNGALRTGHWVPIYKDKHVFSYIRSVRNNHDAFEEKCENGMFILLFNNDVEKEHTVSIAIPKEYLLSKYFINMLTKTQIELISKRLVITVPSQQGILLKNIE